MRLEPRLKGSDGCCQIYETVLQQFVHVELWTCAYRELESPVANCGKNNVGRLVYDDSFWDTPLAFKWAFGDKWRFLINWFPYLLIDWLIDWLNMKTQRKLSKILNKQGNRALPIDLCWCENLQHTNNNRTLKNNFSSKTLHRQHRESRSATLAEGLFQNRVGRRSTWSPSLKCCPGKQTGPSPRCSPIR